MTKQSEPHFIRISWGGSIYQMSTVDYKKAEERGDLECRVEGSALQVVNNAWLVQWINTHPKTRIK